MRPISIVSLSIFLLSSMFMTVAAAEEPRIKASYAHGGPEFVLATGSPGELGLLEALVAEYAKTTPVTLHWVKAGSGASLKLLKARKVDMVMVHAPEAERQALAEGWASAHTLLGSNEFYIVGPAEDPAGVAEAQSAAEAYRRIARARAVFVTRADNSGTHKKEMQIWERAGVEPGGEWYVPSHDFMTASLRKADELGGYFMTDSSTWVAERRNLPRLKLLYRGDPFLVNTYHALLPPPGATANREVAAGFLEFVGGEEGQRIIREYGRARYGEPLYQDADYARGYLH